MAAKKVSFEELVGGKAQQGGGRTAGRSAPRTVGFEELVGRVGNPEADAESADAAPSRAIPVPHPGHAELGDRDPLLLSGDPVRLGVNFLHTYWSSCATDATTGVTTLTDATKYGGGAAPYEDAGQLGAALARQVGLRDLMWAVLALDTVSLEGFQQGQALEPDVQAQLQRNRIDTGGSNADWLAEALLAAASAGLKVLLSFGALGGNGTISTRLPDASGAWEREVSAGGYTFTLDPRAVVLLPWSSAHHGQSLDDFDFPAPEPDPSMSNTEWNEAYNWHMQSLDVSSGYKRGYLRLLGEAVGTVLQGADSALQAEGLTLADVVEGIELFNEVEHLSQYRRFVLTGSGHGASSIHPVEVLEPRESGYRWGRACFQAAHGLRTALGSIAGGDGIAIRLPGICSYSDRDNDSWDDRLRALQGLAAGFVYEAVWYLTTLASPRLTNSEILAYLPTLLQGIDYHYYHAGLFSSEEPQQHIGYLVCEVAEIESTILGALDAQWLESTKSAVAVLDAFPVSVMETGTSVDPDQSYVPSGLAEEQFQAFELCRRLGGALASGAAFAGWHSWMSGKGTAFAEFGLRVDIGDEDADPAEAHQRESWFMFQRLAALLAGVLRGSMVVPDVASRAELETFLSSSDYHPFVVFMYRGSFASGTCSYAWLVLRDPSFLGSSAHQLFARWTDPTAGGTAQEVPLLYADPGTEAASSGLPYRVPTYDANAEIDLGSWLEFPLVEADGPVLLFSDAEIEWLVTPASTSGT